MSATREQLVERLQKVELDITAATEHGIEHSELLEQKKQLLKQLNAANKALNESSQVLKG